MPRKEPKRLPVVSVIVGIITLYALYSIFSLTSSLILLIASIVAALYYFKPSSSAFALTLLMVIPASIMITTSGMIESEFVNLGLFCLILFFGTFMMNLIDWTGSIIGIWLGLLMATPLGSFIILPSLAVTSSYMGMRTGASSAIVFSFFGIFFMWSSSFGYILGEKFASYATFFPNTDFLSTLYFPSILFNSILGAGWVEALSTSWANFFFNLTPFYFAFIAAIVILSSHYGLRLTKKLGFNLPISKAISVMMASFAASILIFGSFNLILASSLLPALMIALITTMKPLFSPRPKLNSNGFRELISGPAIVNGIQFDKMEGVMVEVKPGKSARMSNCWERTRGIDDIKSELIKALALPMKYKKEAEKFGVKPAKGILLYGPPGTGKTTLLRGLASQLGIKYIEINPSEILSKWYGESEQRISEVFSDARDSAPCILAINDIDSIGKERTAYKSDDVTPRVLSVMLTELDNILQSESDTIVVGTTNKPQLLDKALIRPGRFDKIIYIGPPSERAREEIFKGYLMNKSAVSPDINYAILATLSERFTGADIEAVVNKVLSGAFYSEIKDKKDAVVTQSMLEEAIKATRPSLDFAMLEEYERFRVAFQRDRKVVKTWESGIPDIGFDDIGGLDDVKAELRESFELPLRRPDLMEKLRVRPVKGALLYGPPGNGKTLLAKAIATEISANFFVISGAELAKGGVAEASTRIKELFNLAKENTPAIIFLDELDQIAPDRSDPNGKDFLPVTTQLLSELDGVRELKGVMVLAATNRQGAIDSALLRSNRIEKHIFVPQPDEKAREEILAIYLREACLGKDVLIKDLAKMTEGYSGADLQEFVNEAKKSVIRQSIKGEDRDWISLNDFTEAMERMKKSEFKRLTE